MVPKKVFKMGEKEVCMPADVSDSAAGKNS